MSAIFSTGMCWVPVHETDVTIIHDLSELMNLL